LQRTKQEADALVEKKRRNEETLRSLRGLVAKETARQKELKRDIEDARFITKDLEERTAALREGNGKMAEHRAALQAAQDEGKVPDSKAVVALQARNADAVAALKGQIAVRASKHAANQEAETAYQRELAEFNDALAKSRETYSGVIVPYVAIKREVEMAREAYEPLKEALSQAQGGVVDLEKGIAGLSRDIRLAQSIQRAREQLEKNRAEIASLEAARRGESEDEDDSDGEAPASPASRTEKHDG
jgi:chromosome segregation ATPase